MAVIKGSDELSNSYVDERVAYLLPQFEAIAPYKLNQRKTGFGDLLGWKNLAITEARLLKINYPDDKPEHLKTYGTCLRQITAIKKSLKLAAKTALKDPALYNPVCTIITHFGESLSEQFASYKSTQSEQYREKVQERRQPENRIEIDLSSSLQFAHNILTDIKNGNAANWMDVSCAIALSTGRRMGEVHLSASFEKVDDYTVIFKGQLKGKARRVKLGEKAIPIREVPFKIPSLVSADLVCFGLQWLGDKGKRFSPDEDPERVNRRFSKTLNQHCKDFDIFPESDRTYHKFRAAYFRACVVNAGIDAFDFIDYAEKILIDRDETTINSYKRYEIKEGSITRI
ncbi:protelomerase family protein [Nostoc sp. UHCC 0870]|uniref:protelomerase family protein n=1 Tax=Nostoc sp. UHCC 0870 TaxID=2914041 RepID=UPI001EDCC686|nr:protelomerase family protein [Nostoc sp. UHCC 0870]UKP01601.1 telomere resolvase [Nostoc sp. UHCC 0870]